MPNCEWYFAYGSNLYKERLKKRIGKIPEYHRCKLTGYKLVFNKISEKHIRAANIIYEPTEVVWGCIYRLNRDDFNKIDKCEGYPDHYDHLDVDVIDDNGVKYSTKTYIACSDKTDSSSRPTDEYIDFVITGAKQHNLPKSYIEKIKNA